MKQLASISLDLDNQWSYMKTHGDADWAKYPSYFDVFIPHVIEVLDKCEINITFFIVGKDASFAKNRASLQLLVEKGHEVGNHSYNHEVWIHKNTKRRIKHEIQKADDSISGATGVKPIGFRGPGFVWSSKLLEVLSECEYRYDSSTLPTYLNPLAKMYYFWKSDFSKEEKEQRKDIFGKFTDGFKPVKPYFWEVLSGNRILEIPVTTIPILKTPFHLSYLLYLSRFSKMIMYFYLSIAIFMCKLTNTQPSFLLHPLDLISGDKVPELKFFPGMNLSGERKIELFHSVICILKKHFVIVNMADHLEEILKTKSLKTVKL